MTPFIVWVFIIVAVIIVNASTKSKKQRQKKSINQQGTYMTQQTPQQAYERQRALSQQTRAKVQTANEIYEQRNRMNETKARLQEKFGTEKQDSEILAKVNANVQKTRTDQFVNVQEDSILGTVSDLMAKGYSGNLSFERDFVGEAMDMLAGYLSMPETENIVIQKCHK